MEELQKKVEALLFSSGKAMSFEEIRKITRCRDEQELRKALEVLRDEYNSRDSSLMIAQEGDKWKIITKESYVPVVKKIVSETELTKSVMETLAVIAWKYPIKQSNLIKIRTNKAYDHLNQLEELGYISRQKHGRTKLIKLTNKFFSYFDLPPDRLKEKFQDFDQIAKAIQEKEIEIENLKAEKKKQLEEEKKKREAEEKELKEGPEVDLMTEKGKKEKLEVYEEPKEVLEKEAAEEEKETPSGVEIEKEKLGQLEVVEEPQEAEEIKEKKEEEKQKEEIEGPKEEGKKEEETKEEIIPEKPRMELSEEAEKAVEKRAEEILHPGKEEESKEEDKEKTEEEKEEPESED